MHALDLTRPTHERRYDPACEPDDDGAKRRRQQFCDMESRDQPGDERKRDAVDDQDEQSQGQDRERQGEEKQNRPNQRIDHAKHQRGDDQRARAGDHDAGEELIGDPQPQGGDQQSDKESSHGAEDNRCARPATNRAVMPGRACTPSFESRRIEPLSESRPPPDSASDTPANGPTSAGQPLTIACSGWPNQFTANVSARGARNTSRPRNRHSRSMTTVALSRMTSSRRKRSEEHTSELQSPYDLVCRLLLEKKKNTKTNNTIVVL